MLREQGRERRDALSYFLIIVPSPRVARSALTIDPSIDKRGNIFNNKFDFNSLSLYLSEIKPESVSRINGQVAEGDAATVPLVGGMGRI